MRSLTKLQTLIIASQRGFNPCSEEAFLVGGAILYVLPGTTVLWYPLIVGALRSSVLKCDGLLYLVSACPHKRQHANRYQARVSGPCIQRPVQRPHCGCLKSSTSWREAALPAAQWASRPFSFMPQGYLHAADARLACLRCCKNSTAW